MPAVLHRAGVPLAPALAGVLTYRVLGTLLPAIGGAVALVHLRRTPVPPLPVLTVEGELADAIGVQDLLEEPGQSTGATT
jgi:hypothetical protein